MAKAKIDATPSRLNKCAVDDLLDQEINLVYALDAALQGLAVMLSPGGDDETVAGISNLVAIHRKNMQAIRDHLSSSR